MKQKLTEELQFDRDYNKEPMLLLSSNRGVFIPQEFMQLTQGIKNWQYGIDHYDKQMLFAGPGSEWYWQAWDTLLRNCTFQPGDNSEWTLYQDGDLWLIPEGFDVEAWENGGLDE